VSTRGQLLDRQVLALEAAGCSKVFPDKQSAATSTGPTCKPAWATCGPATCSWCRVWTGSPGHCRT
jgi:hypothetical protein